MLTGMRTFAVLAELHLHRHNLAPSSRIATVEPQRSQISGATGYVPLHGVNLRSSDPACNMMMTSTQAHMLRKSIGVGVTSKALLATNTLTFCLQPIIHKDLCCFHVPRLRDLYIAEVHVLRPNAVVMSSIYASVILHGDATAFA